MDQMTVLEHLRFYARVRGVTEIEHNVKAVLKAVGLEAFASRMAAKLSGGNKRKLSLGIALIGNPTVLLLDEPSSGMDAAAKRVMWKTLAALVPGRSLLLTTHSMEEADALADRAGIMAGRMLAIGTSDYLRRKHGNGYYLHLVMKSAPHTSDQEITKLESWIMARFPGANIEDKTYHGQIRFSVPAGKDIETESKVTDVDEITGDGEVGSGSRIGSFITILEENRDELGLEHYSVSPTTLDQVFLTIVGKHNVQEEGYGGTKLNRSLLKRLRRK
jgi:ABC-type multidrug transport system ATPase subunit